MKKHSKVEDELQQKQIQGLFEAREAEGRFWFLLARVTLAGFAKVGEAGLIAKIHHSFGKANPGSNLIPPPKQLKNKRGEKNGKT